MNFSDFSVIGLIVLAVQAIILAIYTGYLKNGYLPEKGKLRALAEENEDIRERLIKNTDIVESIRDDLANKSWAMQQVWAAKKASYDQVWKNLLDMKEYVSDRMAVDGSYYEIFINNCGYSGIDEDMYPEEQVKDYYETADQEIKLEKEKFNRKYNTEQYVSELELKKKQYIKNLNISINNIELQSIYLSPDIAKVSSFLKELVSHQFKDNSYTWENSEQGSLSMWEWYEHILEEYERLSNEIDQQMLYVKNLAKQELHL
ncbi:hypothetical protein [Vibrio lentus]|uniref:hypothetical protein n=1 Tax=Vibrio lentus TaxID=136468 RepID=UPI00178CE6B2|nr:hypothetical protein [Vibrio lentus]MDN3631240.1 hypothetical protein [Vibrio lentus]MDN3632752.1 hypothetical protein [Vibrio lentus]